MKPRSCFPIACLMACAFVAVAARGELALTNYSAGNPLKILDSGDSITDDSVTNGAWRAFLEPLLDSNGYAFTNLGRWTSVPGPGFTQIHHEGMDGAVIGAPGLSGPTHGYAASNNYALLTLSDALTNAAPDLFLIDLGVNDMGRGRDPNYVATNDLSGLLDMIFARLPSAHVIVSRPTTISYSTLLSPPYDTYYTNMFTFCTAVQGVATARRAQGQNVFVADLFSAITNQNMLNSDGTHPNATGLAAIAKEMMFRIGTITSRPNLVTTPFIYGGSTWKYSDQGLNLGTNWSQLGFDDSTWSQGPGRLGYGEVGMATTVGYGPSSANRYVTTYFRQSFVVPSGVLYTNLNLRLNSQDGAAVWLNGTLLYSVNMPAQPFNSQTLATGGERRASNTNLDDSNTYYPTNLSIISLPAGTNVIAVEIHKVNTTYAYLTFDLELFGMGVPSPTITFTPSPGALQLAWPSNYTNFSLQYVSNLASANGWQLVPGPYPVSNNAFQVSISTTSGPEQFFRLIAP